MIKKLLYGSVLFIIISSLSLIFILGSNLIGMNEKIINLSKNIMFNVLILSYIHGCNSPIYYTGQYISSHNMIDIVICNHITNFDFFIYAGIIQKFDKRNIYFYYQKEVIFIPILGAFGSANDLGMYYKDTKASITNMTNIIKNITNGVIVIMPEGIISSEKVRIKSDEYCNINKLPIFKNLLYPKKKGLWILCNILTKMKKMGNIIDISIIINNFYKKQITIKDLLLKNYGNTYLSIRNIHQDKKNLFNYNEFKKWLINVWTTKDNIIETMLSENKYTYKLLKPPLQIYNYLFILFMIILFFYLIILTRGLYFIISIIILYIVIIIKYKSNIKNIFKFIKYLLFER